MQNAGRIICCTKCNKVIMDINENGVYKLHTRILLFETGSTIALCPKCKTEITVPVLLSKTVKSKVRHVIVN